jgi:hypothetical protein
MDVPIRCEKCQAIAKALSVRAIPDPYLDGTTRWRYVIDCPNCGLKEQDSKISPVRSKFGAHDIAWNSAER